MIVAVCAFFFSTRNKKDDIVVEITEREPISMCYQYIEETSDKYSDRAFLQMEILNQKISGEYQNLPAESDSKVGEFTGVVGPMDVNIGGRVADVWWDSFAEGMRVTEQLKIEFGEGSAVVFFGEMIDRGDGVYVYKDDTKLTGGFQMSQTDCESLRDKIIVEKYIKDNIKNIILEKPVLGGSWYPTFIKINPSLKTGEIIYEDGHIEGRLDFSYERKGEEVKVNIIKDIPLVDKDPIACTMDAKQCPDGSYVGRTGPRCEFICL